MALNWKAPQVRPPVLDEGLAGMDSLILANVLVSVSKTRKLRIEAIEGYSRYQPWYDEPMIY